MGRMTFATNNGEGATTDGNTLVFLANSGKLMTVVGLTVDLDTLLVPLVGGEFKLLNDLQPDDSIALPLMTNHSNSIQEQAGVIQKLEQSLPHGSVD